MRALAEVITWWGVTFAVWLATVQSVSASEALVGGFCALCCALPAPWLRRANSLVLHRFPEASDQPESAVRR
jgi:hypothetical protein